MFATLTIIQVWEKTNMKKKRKEGSGLPLELR